MGADVSARKEISIPILGRQSSTGDSILNSTYLSATKPQQAPQTSNSASSDYYLYPGKYTNTTKTKAPGNQIKNQQKKSN